MPGSSASPWTASGATPPSRGIGSSIFRFWPISSPSARWHADTSSIAPRPVCLLEDGDYAFPDCGPAHPLFREVRRRMGHRLRLVFRNFPLAEMHPHAVKAAETAEAAAIQGKFWEMHDLLFENQVALEDS